MKNFEQRKPVYSIAALFLVVAIFLLGRQIGFSQGIAHQEAVIADQQAQIVAGLANQETDLDAETTADFAPFWKTWNILQEKYPFTSKAPLDQDKVWGAIKGLTSSYHDPYTEFFPPAEQKEWEEYVGGKFSGVGMEVGLRKGILTIIAPLKNTPAERAGVKSGDIVVEIDEVSTGDLTLSEAVQLIRGEKGSTVMLTIFRPKSEETLEIPIIRDIINVPVIDTYMIDDDIFAIELYHFAADSDREFALALQEFIDSGRSKLIIDLRDNPGGFLDASINIASWFLPKGKVVVREATTDVTEDSETLELRSAGYDIFTDQLELVILVNEGSASASEILAGALSEHGIATLVGTQTFGKGSVQEVFDVTDEVSVKITVAKWLTPNRVSISDEGLTPDVVVEIDPSVNYDEIGEYDPQVQKAIELLRK